MRLCIFEDARVDGLEPLALTRPVFDLRCGIRTLLEKQVRAVRGTALGALVRPPLARLAVLEHPHLTVNESDWLHAGPAVLVNARWLPPRRFQLDAVSTSYLAIQGDDIVYAALTADELAGCTPLNLHDCLADWRKRLPIRPATGRLITHPWDLVEWTADEIGTDFQSLGRDDGGGRPSTLTLIGPSAALWVHETARVDPFVVVDTSDGPVVIDRDAVVTSFTRLEGPCYIGPRTEVFGAIVRAGTSLGPNCRVGGEVSASTFLGNSNKPHVGFLGHSYVGEWVNIGSGTHAGDLRNDYADIHVRINGRLIDTGLAKVGSYIGDHAKAGIGCRLNAGSNIGPFAQLLPCGPLLPKYVPPFCTVDHGRLMDCANPQLLFDAADRVTARRGEEFSLVHRALFKGLYDRGIAHRRTAIHEAEMRRLRRA